MKKCALFSIVSSLILLGCSSTEPQSQANQDETFTSVELVPNKQAPARVLLRGQIVIGHESRTIQPCNSNTTYWLSLPESVRRIAESMTSKPYQPMYAEVFGYFEPATMGFAEEFGSQFVVTEFNIITAENPNRCDQPTRDARAFGNEPSWSAGITDNAITLMQLGKETQVLPVVNLEQDTKGTRYDLVQGKLEVNYQVCRDSMSDSIYGRSAQLTTKDQTYVGCSTDSNEYSDLSAGEYSQSIDNSTNLTLSLRPDHLAETRYSYTDGSDDVVESGYWQTLESGLVQVTSVTYQGQKIIATREFELKGDTLSTEHETINGATYPLTNGGLTLKKAQ
ncbi:COG3650 family protein [Vibrio comitans]